VKLHAAAKLRRVRPLPHLMSELTGVISQVRASVVAIARVHLARPAKEKKGKLKPAQWKVALVGTGWCVVDDRFVVTAHHVFAGGKARDPNDRFYAFSVPHNRERACKYNVVGFPYENTDFDMAVLELGPCDTNGEHLVGLPLTADDVPDGARVVTVGFPSPEIASVGIDETGNWMGAQMFLKSHANEGIVSAHYRVGVIDAYELNVGWHHGESGGPVVRVEDPVAAFSLMQHYRNIQSPHGIVAGPHRGLALRIAQSELLGIGARFI
jgi:hypothetical protein